MYFCNRNEREKAPISCSCKQIIIFIMTIQEILSSDLSVSITINSKELKTFLNDVIDKVQTKKNEDEVFLGVDEVCTLTGKVRSTLWIWEKRGYLKPASRIGKVLKYRKSDVLTLMNGGGKG